MSLLQFRAWYTPFGGSVKKFNKMKHGSAGSLLTHAEMSPDDYKIMQSTGLKDKNGVEIYEGDIVLENGMEQVISLGEQRYEENFGDVVYYIGFNIFTKWGYSSIDPKEHEVIGNIYENPELLEEIK